MTEIQSFIIMKPHVRLIRYHLKAQTTFLESNKSPANIATDDYSNERGSQGSGPPALLLDDCHDNDESF